MNSSFWFVTIRKHPFDFYGGRGGGLFLKKIFKTRLRNKRFLRPCAPHMRMTDQLSGTICEILVECIMRNNSGSVVQEMLFKRFLI